MFSGKWEVVRDARSSCDRHSATDDYIDRSLYTGNNVRLWFIKVGESQKLIYRGTL
jgi:hypothetical protein